MVFDPWNIKGQIALNQNLLADAQNAFQKLIEYQPDHVDAHLELGKVFINQKQYDKAYLEISEANKLKPDDLETKALLNAFITES